MSKPFFKWTPCKSQYPHTISMLFFAFFHVVSLLANGEDMKLSPCIHSSYSEMWKFGGKSISIG